MGAPKGHAPYNTRGEGGRPIIHNDAFIEDQAKKLREWIKEPNNFWLNDFCIQQGLLPQNMSEWANKNQRFSEVYKLAKADQEAKIYKGAILNNYNSQMAKMGLTNHHGWRDQQHNTIAGDAQNPLTCVLEHVSGKSKDLVDE